MTKLVLLWLDAFSDRYLNPELCPFLWNLSRNCFFAKIQPLFAYRGIQYCFEYGVSLKELGVWNDHVFAGFDALDKAKNGFIKEFLKFVDRISPSDDWNKILRFFLFKLAGIEYGTPHLIPADLLDAFLIPKISFKRKSLYEILEENGIKYLRKEPKLNSSEAVLIKKIPKLLKNYDALFFKFNSLDRLGHKYGPLSNVVRQRVTFLDTLIRELVSRLGKNAVLIIMSDHGMVPVTHHFDLTGFLKSKDFEFRKHYMAFVGATYASFWFRDKKYGDAIMEKLRTLEVGRFLTLDDKVRLGIDNIGREYAEEIFAVKEGNVFFPEFYHARKCPQGMHGYAFSKYDMPIFLIRSDKCIGIEAKIINFVDIKPIILRLLYL